MGMTKHHHDQILDSQTSNAKKVYECIPSADFWTGPQIAAELFRQGSKQDTNRVMGCIKMTRAEHTSLHRKEKH